MLATRPFASSREGARTAVPGAEQWSSPCFWAPAALGLAGAATLLAFAGLTPASAAWGVLLSGLGLGLGYRLAIWHLRRIEASLPADHDDLSLSRMRELLVSIGPVWGRQIDTCRDTADKAVASLASDFSEMVERLESALSASQGATSAMGGADTGIVAAIQRSETDLANVIGVLRGLQRSRESILGKVGEYAVNLREMAADVQQIALQIRLLSLNGAIEAARAGEAGKAFAVVVSEMRRLSSESAEIGARISKKVEVVNAAVADIFLDTGKSSGEDGASIGQAERDAAAVVERFKGMTTGLRQSVAIMERESVALRERISNALVALQFQDRVSQILAHAAQSMDALGAAAAGDAQFLSDPQSWVQQMQRSFTTQEEFENLSGTQGAKRVEHEVQFF